jgi:hypothetical protein
MINTIVSSPDEWTSIDAEKLASFLGSETGRRLLVKLADQIPQLHEAGHVNKILIRSGEVRGQTALIQFFQSLAHPSVPLEAPVGNYPPLELDSAWDVPATAEPKSAPKE